MSVVDVGEIITFVNLYEIFCVLFFDEDISVFESDNVAWYSNNPFDVVFPHLIDMRAKNHDISPFRITEMYWKFAESLKNGSDNIRFVVFLDLLKMCRKIQIREFVDENIFCVVVARFHGIPIDPKRCNEK